MGGLNREVLRCSLGSLAGAKAERAVRRKGPGQREGRTLPGGMAASINGADRSGNSREELKATSVEVMFRMKGLTMLWAQSHQPYFIGVTAAVK
jgi:hypothetical protein